MVNNFNHLFMGLNISKTRQENHLTQKQLAQMIGMSSQTLSQYERNVKIPSIMALEKISGALNVTVDHLLQGTTNINFSHEKAAELNAFLMKMDYNSLLDVNEIMDQLILCYYSSD